jgi:transposase
MTFIRRMKKGNKVYLCEYRSVREGKKVRSIFVRYLGVESDQEKIPLPKKQVVNWRPPERSVRAGDVTVLFQIAQELQMAETIDRICGSNGRRRTISPGKLLTAWAINRALDPESATQLEDWIVNTDLPELFNLSSKGLNKDSFLSALDFICSYDKATDRVLDQTKAIDEMLYAKWRNIHPLPKGTDEILAYDMTSLLTYGKTCPLLEKGYNAEEWRHQQINLSLLVSKHDNQPLAHEIHPGNHASMTTMQHLMPRLCDFAISQGTIIWDRGNTSQKTVTATERLGWKIICGIPKISKDAKNIVIETEVSESPANLIPCKKSGELYACKVKAQIFGNLKNVVVYRNVTQAAKSLVKRNKAIFEINEELKVLKIEQRFSSQKELQVELKRILNGYYSFFDLQLLQEDGKVDFSWSINEERLAEAKGMDGKYLLYSTDEQLSAAEVVRMYLEKDFIEKVFRCIKTDEEIKPFRHRLETRVRAFIFISILAFRLLAALRWMINSSESSNVTLSTSEFLKKLSRVQVLEADLGKEIDRFYVNMTSVLSKQLVAIGMKDILVGHRFLKS